MSEARMSVECTSEVRADEGGEVLHVYNVDSWLAGLPSDAVLQPIIRDFGSQRDPDERLVGLRAKWSENRE